MIEYEPSKQEVVFNGEASEQTRVFLERTFDDGLVAQEAGLPLLAFLARSREKDVGRVAIPVESAQILREHCDLVESEYQEQAQQSRRVRILGKIGLLPTEVEAAKEIRSLSSGVLEYVDQHTQVQEAETAEPQVIDVTEKDEEVARPVDPWEIKAETDARRAKKRAGMKEKVGSGSKRALVYSGLYW